MCEISDIARVASEAAGRPDKAPELQRMLTGWRRDHPRWWRSHRRRTLTELAVLSLHRGGDLVRSAP